MNAEEKWLPIAGHENSYLVSDAGNVASLNYAQSGEPRKLKMPLDADGYPKVTLRKDGGQRTRPVHALVMETFVGPRPHGHDINHKSGVKTDNRLANLEYCTKSENSLHSYRLGLQKGRKGSSHHNAKFGEAEVAYIKARLALGERKTRLATEFNVSFAAIHYISTGQRWGHVAPLRI